MWIKVSTLQLNLVEKYLTSSGNMELLQWDVTKRCNLNCKHCRLGDNNRDGKLPFKNGIKLLEEAKILDVKIFNFSGGEPFLRDDIFHLIDIASNFFEEVVVTTNGTLITEKLADKLSSYKNLRLSISLDGYGETHDRFRGTEGVFRKVVSGLKILKKRKIRFSIKSTISTLTTEPFKLVGLVKKFGGEYLTIRSVISVGRAKSNLMLDTPTYIKIVKKTMDIGEKLKVKIFSDDPILIPLFPNLVGETFKSIKNLYAGCGAGDSVAYIDASGNVYPCAYIPLKAGNIKTSSLVKIVKHSQIFNLLRRSREKLKGKCGGCQYKYVCGGCRAIALKLCGDLLAEDPRCAMVLK